MLKGGFIFWCADQFAEIFLVFLGALVHMSGQHSPLLKKKESFFPVFCASYNAAFFQKQKI